MIQLALLMSGATHLQNNLRLLVVLSLLWGGLGLGIFIDGIDGATYFPVRVFGLFLLVESLITLSVSYTGLGAQKYVLLFKGTLFLFCAVVILINKKYSNLLLSLILGFSFILIGFFSVMSAWLVRYPGWKKSTVIGLMYMLFSVILFSRYQSAVSLFLGFTMALSGISCVTTAQRARRFLTAGTVFPMLQPTSLRDEFKLSSNELPLSSSRKNEPMVVHVWTPEGAALAPTISRPVINRYIAAVDVRGVISTGHAAVEVPGDLYISLYPAEDIDRSPSEFLRLLRATAENDVPGRYLTDYPSEAAESRDSNRQVIFSNYNHATLSYFWAVYQRTGRYNLTSRNCSSSAAFALEAALDGIFADKNFWVCFFKICLMPELWIAAQIRRRALNMAWTPGLVLDYARALRAIVEPVPEAWHQRLGKLLWKNQLEIKTGRS